MSRDIPESDWKQLRQLHPVALERYCLKVLEEIALVAADTSESAHQRYRKIYGLVQERDEMISAVFSGLRRSTGIMQLVMMHAQGLVTEEEIGRFTQSTREVIARFAADRAR